MSTTATPQAIETFRESVNPACYQAICDAFESEQPGLVDALPAQGKSRGLILWAAEHQKPLTVYTLRHDLYRQFESSCAELGLNYIRIPSQLADCPLGKHYEVTHGKKPLADPEKWEKTFENGYKKWGSAVTVHKRYGDKLPCQADGPCPYIRSRAGFHRLLEEVEDGNAPPYDVIIGNYLHAHTTYGKRIPGRYTKGRYVAFDEFPQNEAVTKFSSTEVHESITAYLKQDPDLPFKNYEHLRDERDEAKHQQAIESWFELQSYWSEFDGLLGEQQPNVLPVAPLLTQAALSWGKGLSNKYSYAEIGDNSVAAYSGDKGSVWLLRRPKIDGLAKSVIALDGTPTLKLWQAILPGAQLHEVLPTDSEKREYLRNELGLRIIQTSRHIKPYARGDHFDHTKPKNQTDGVNRAAVKDMLAFRWIIETEVREEAPSIISTKAAIEAYQREGLSKLVADDEYYNNLIGMNDFGRSRFGIVSGCNYIGDEEVKMWAALCNESVEAKENDEGTRIAGTNLDFGKLGNSILYAVRENDVLQAAMRFGREPDEDGNRGATVYVHTAALPAWVEAEKRVPRVNLWIDDKGMTQVLKLLRDADDAGFREWTVTEMHEAVRAEYPEAVGRKQVGRILNELHDFGLLDKERRTGPDSGRGSPLVFGNFNQDSLVEYEIGYVVSPVTQGGYSP